MSVVLRTVSIASALALSLTLASCSTSSTGASSASENGAQTEVNAPASVQDQLKVIEVLLVSMQESDKAGLTEKSSGYIYAYDPETNRSIRYYKEQGEQPLVWEEGNRGSTLRQIMDEALGGVSEVSQSADSISFTLTDAYGSGQPIKLTLLLKDGFVVEMNQGDEFSSDKIVLEYSVSDEAKAAFAKAVSPEEAYPEEFVEEPLQ